MDGIGVAALALAPLSAPDVRGTNPRAYETSVIVNPTATQAQTIRVNERSIPSPSPLRLFRHAP